LVPKNYFDISTQKAKLFSSGFFTLLSRFVHLTVHDLCPSDCASKPLSSDYIELSAMRLFYFCLFCFFKLLSITFPVKKNIQFYCTSHTRKILKRDHAIFCIHKNKLLSFSEFPSYLLFPIFFESFLLQDRQRKENNAKVKKQ